MSKTKTKPKKAAAPETDADVLKKLEAAAPGLTPLGHVIVEEITIEKQVVTDLASCVLWALKFLKTQSGAGMWTDMNAKPMVVMPWQEKFMKALDGVGYCIDRDEFWKKDDKKKPRRRR